MRKWFQNIFLFCTVLLALLLLLECSFRWYWVDYYAPEFEALNSGSDLDENPHLKTIMVAGDSFSANTNSYVSHLRKNVSSEYRVINCAIPGTGILETSFVLPTRIKAFEPDIFIYQIYLGNDLLDIKHRPTGEVTSLRKFYYLVSDNFRFIKFVNYRFGQIRRSIYTDVAPQEQPQGKPFSIDGYAPRQKLIFKEEPRIIENTTHLLNRRVNDMKVLTQRLSSIINLLESQTEVYLLILPHCAEISDTYKERMKMVGAEFRLSTESDDVGFQQILKRALPSAQILDAKLMLQKELNNGNSVYYDDDPHLSSQGQSAVGEWLRVKCNL